MTRVISTVLGIAVAGLPTVALLISVALLFSPDQAKQDNHGKWGND